MYNLSTLVVFCPCSMFLKEVQERGRGMVALCWRRMTIGSVHMKKHLNELA